MQQLTRISISLIGICDYKFKYTPVSKIKTNVKKESERQVTKQYFHLLIASKQLADLQSTNSLSLYHKHKRIFVTTCTLKSYRNKSRICYLYSHYLHTCSRNVSSIHDRQNAKIVHPSKEIMHVWWTTSSAPQEHFLAIMRTPLQRFNTNACTH